MALPLVCQFLRGRLAPFSQDAAAVTTAAVVRHWASLPLEVPSEVAAAVASRNINQVRLPAHLQTELEAYLSEVGATGRQAKSLAWELTEELKALSRSQQRGGSAVPRSATLDAIEQGAVGGRQRLRAWEVREAQAVIEAGQGSLLSQEAYNAALGLPPPLAAEEREAKRLQQLAPTYNRASQVAGYVLARLVPAYAALTRVLSEAKRLVGPGWRPREVLAYNAGAGAPSWATQEVWPEGVLNMLCVEASVPMQLLASRLDRAQRAHLGGGPRMNWVRELPQLTKQAAGQRRRYDLVVCAYALGPLPEQRRQQLIRNLWDRCGDVLVLIEPGTPAGFADVRDARMMVLRLEAAKRARLEAARSVPGSGGLDALQRQKLDNAGAHVLAPCTHDGACPMQGKKMWCHFGQQLQRPPFMQRAKGVAEAATGGARNVQDEKFSYVVLRRGPRPSLDVSVASTIYHQLHRPGPGAVDEHLDGDNAGGDAADSGARSSSEFPLGLGLGRHPAPRVHIPPAVVRRQALLNKAEAAAAAAMAPPQQGGAAGGGAAGGADPGPVPMQQQQQLAAVEVPVAHGSVVGAFNQRYPAFGSGLVDRLVALQDSGVEWAGNPAAGSSPRGSIGGVSHEAFTGGSADGHRTTVTAAMSPSGAVASAAPLAARRWRTQQQQQEPVSIAHEGNGPAGAAGTLDTEGGSTRQTATAATAEALDASIAELALAMQQQQRRAQAGAGWGALPEGSPQQGSEHQDGAAAGAAADAADVSLEEYAAAERQLLHAIFGLHDAMDPEGGHSPGEHAVRDGGADVGSDSDTSDEDGDVQQVRVRDPRAASAAAVASLQWGRLYRPPRRRGRHVILDLCTGPQRYRADDAPAAAADKEAGQEDGHAEAGDVEEMEDGAVLPAAPAAAGDGGVETGGAAGRGLPQLEAGRLVRQVVAKSARRSWMGAPAYRMARRLQWGDVWPDWYTRPHNSREVLDPDLRKRLMRMEQAHLAVVEEQRHQQEEQL